MDHQQYGDNNANLEVTNTATKQYKLDRANEQIAKLEEGNKNLADYNTKINLELMVAKNALRKILDL